MTSRETIRPVVSGDERHWPTTKLIETQAYVSSSIPVRKRVSFLQRQHPRSDLTLQAVNNTPIHTFGTRSHTLNLGFHCRRNVDADPRSRLPAEFRTAGRSETQQVGGLHYQSRGPGNQITGDIRKPNVAPQEAS